MSAADVGLPAPARGLDPTLRGVLAMLVAMACFCANDTLVKLTAARLPASEIMALRGAIAIVLVLAALRALGLHRRLGALARPMVLLRSLVEAAIAVCFITALARLGLAEITTLLQATPLALTALSVVVLRAKVGWRRWAAVGVGFLGVLLVVKPSAGGFTPDAGLALLSAVLVAVRDLMTRAIPPATAPSLVVTFGATIAVAAVGLAIGAAAPAAWVAPTPADLARLGGAAALVVAGNIAIVTAFRSGDMTVVGSFRYSVILWSLAMGAIVWGDRPDAIALAGAALIVVSGLYALRRERAPTAERPLT